MSKQTNRFAAAAKKAKRLYKTGRYKKFSDAMRVALKGGTKRTKRKGSRRVVKKSTVKRDRTVRRKASAIQTHKSGYRSALSEKLKTYLYLKDRASGKRLKRHYGKVINEIKRQLRTLS